MTVAELDALLLARSESEQVEFKEAKNRYDFEELVRYCVALANEGGGQMVLGVTDALPRRVVGTNAFDVPEHPQRVGERGYDPALRKTTHGYPKKAIREVVGNALVHQDLDERGTGVTVEVFDDRIEVTNPGLPILPVDRFIDENQSRNERFADALRQLGICEERGHGMDAVVTEIEGAQLPPYQCRLGSHHTTVTLLRYKPLKNLTPDERTSAVYQHCCLRFVNNQITNNESLRERFKIEKQNAATASRLLAEVVAAKKIKPVDVNAANKLMRYLPYWA